MLARMLSIGSPAASRALRIELLEFLVTTGIMSSTAASIPAIAEVTRLHVLVAAVIGGAVDHRLRPCIHVGESPLGQPGNVLQTVGRQRRRERLPEIGDAARRQLVEDAVGMGLKRRLQVSRTVRGDTEGNIAARSAICNSPSSPSSVTHRRVRRPEGWCEENTSMRFSWLKMSSRQVKTIEPSCGTNAIGASRRIFASVEYGSAQKLATSMSNAARWTWAGGPGRGWPQRGEAGPNCQTRSSRALGPVDSKDSLSEPIRFKAALGGSLGC